MAIEKKIGERIKIERKARKLTQEQLAEKADLDRGYLSEIENGHTNFSISSLAKIAKALNLNLADLVDHYTDD